MLDFSVGDPELQDLLEWVAQPPPSQGRDTHALHFWLRGTPIEKHIYAGSLFFRPGNPTAFSFRDQPGLCGIGTVLPNVPACKDVLGIDTPTPHDAPPPVWVRVEVRFRPPKIHASLLFKGGAAGPLNGLPGDTLRAVEFNEVIFNPGLPMIRMIMDPPNEWRLTQLEKTNVLLQPMS